MIKGKPNTVANIARFMLPALCLRFILNALRFSLARSNKTAVTYMYTHNTTWSVDLPVAHVNSDKYDFINKFQDIVIIVQIMLHGEICVYVW